MSASAKIRVVIDIREEELWKEFGGDESPVGSPDEWSVEKKALDVGDIAFYVDTNPVPALVCERKTAEDLGASQKDGRYREQRARLYALRGAGTAIAYIVESPPWSFNLSRTWCRGSFSEVHLQQAIARLMLRHTIPVFHSTKVSETASWIRRFAKALCADPTVYTSGLATTACEAAHAYTEAIHVKKAENSSPERIFLCFLLAIPGLGKSAAEAIAEATQSSFQKLCAMSESELMEIKGGKRKLGKTIAAALYAALHS